MENMKYYNIGRKVPDEAKKTIAAGKLKGFTDINPMWRIKVLTEMFGPCGIGWYIDDVRYWTEEGKDGRVAAFCELKLYIREGVGEGWSKPIKGVGGSMLVNIFKGQAETSDEAYKMAYTDAISVACKALGIGADVYWDKDRTKYNQNDNRDDKTAEPVICTQCGATLKPDIKTKSGWLKAHEFAEKFGGLCPDCVVKKAVEMQGEPK